MPSLSWSVMFAGPENGQTTKPLIYYDIWNKMKKYSEKSRESIWELEYRGSPLSTIFGTWKKSYYAKFVLVESISTSTNLPSKSPTSTDTNHYQFSPLPQAPDYTNTLYNEVKSFMNEHFFLSSYIFMRNIKSVYNTYSWCFKNTWNVLWKCSCIKILFQW